MKISLTCTLSGIVAAIGLLGPAWSAEPASPVRSKATVVGAQGLEPALREKLGQLFTLKTTMVAADVRRAPLPGFFEFSVGTTVFYMDAAGKWLLDGHLVDLDTKSSVTAARKLELEKANQPPALDWRSLNLSHAIKTQRGAAVPGRVLVLFEDPNCGFCKKLHVELEQMSNLVTYTFPMSFLQGSLSKNAAIWCAKDRSAEWTRAMKDQAITGAGACNTDALAANAQLATQLMIQGTPTIFLADGTRISGLVTAAALEKSLAKAAK
jgi:thiol:disulfide interchange protein DsbC